MATHHLTQHPTLHEVLLPFYTHDDVSDVVRTLEAINRDHLNQGELLQLDFELPKLRRYSSMPGVVKVSIERLMGLRPPRRHKDCAVFTYLDPLTAKLEHLSITRTLEKLRGTKLGMVLYDERSKHFKPKHVLAAIQSSPFQDIAQDVAPLISKSITGAEAELCLIGALSERTVRDLVADYETSIARADQITPTFVLAELGSKQLERIAYFHSV